MAGTGNPPPSTALTDTPLTTLTPVNSAGQSRSNPLTSNGSSLAALCGPPGVMRREGDLRPVLPPAFVPPALREPPGPVVLPASIPTPPRAGDDRVGGTLPSLIPLGGAGASGDGSGGVGRFFSPYFSRGANLPLRAAAPLSLGGGPAGRRSLEDDLRGQVWGRGNRAEGGGQRWGPRVGDSGRHIHACDNFGWHIQPMRRADRDMRGLHAPDCTYCPPGSALLVMHASQHASDPQIMVGGIDARLTFPASLAADLGLQTACVNV